MADKPPTMDWASNNLPETFRMFKQRMELYFTIHHKLKQEERIATILLASGEEGLRRFNSWDLPEDEKKNANTIWQKFSEQIEPADNFRINRLQLSFLRQKPDESLDDFVNRSKIIANKCNFSKDELQQRLIEIIIAATPIADFQKELLTKPLSYTLDETIKLGRTYEASQAHVNALKSFDFPTNTEKPIDMVRKSYTSQNTTRKSLCKNCGKDHPHNKELCPAAKSICGACGKTGHWAKFCITTKYMQRSQSRQRTHSYRDTQKNIHSFAPQEPYFDGDAMNEQLESFSFSSISSEIADRNEVFTTLQIQLDNLPGIHNLTLKIDTGAQANTIPIRLLRKMYPEKMITGQPAKHFLTPVHTKLTAYNGSQIECYGSLQLMCQHKNINAWHKTEFFVVDAPGHAILGLPCCEKFKVISLHCTIQRSIQRTIINNTHDLQAKYPNQFDRIGEFKTEHKLVVDPNVPARINPPRKIPIALKDTIKNELDNMCKQNVIRKIEEPTNWVSSLTYVTKQNGSLRICLDPKHLNNALLRPHHNVPTVEDLNHKFTGAKYFSKLDAKSGYWSVKLHPESQPLTTFQTPFGRYCFQRLPFGLSVSQDIFQMEMDRILEKCTNACGISDDIIVFGTTEEEHDRHLVNLMNTAEQAGLVFNSEKCQIKCKEVTFFGHVYNEDGIKPDPNKIKDLQKMPEPTSKADLQHFLGFATYLSKFIPDFSEKTAILRDLLSKDAVFIWEKHHKKTLDTIKNEVSEHSILQYYDPKKPVELQCDASLRGLGAALLQPDSNNNMKPIAFASKSLTPTEQRYACIERELLAIVFATQRFHTFLFGRHFHVITDHRPLLMILNKPITSAPPRLQRMIMSLNGYNFNISYRPGSENQLADGLSRLPNMANQGTIDLDIRVDTVNFSSDRISKIKETSTKDPVFNRLKENIINGWPDHISKLQQDIRPFWSFRDQLSIENGLFFKGQRILIPHSQQQDILQQLHTAHLGMEKTKLLANISVYWIGINKAIDKIVSECKICQEHQRAQTPEPLMPHDIPNRPWSTLATDIFDFNQQQYLVIADYYSKFPIIRKLPQPAPSSAVINITKQLFSEFGIPDKMVSDNGPHFASQSYNEFSKSWQFQHVTTSPRRPQGNGFIERQIQTIKNIMKKARQAQTDPFLALLHWRSTPVSSKLGSPAQLLMGRQFKSTIPARINNKSDQDSDEIHEHLEDRQNHQKRYHDQHALAQQLPPLYVGQPVRILNHNTGHWLPATIAKKTDDPRSYILRDMNGQMLRRNRQHIRDIPAASAINPDAPRPTNTFTPYNTTLKKHVTFNYDVPPSNDQTAQDTQFTTRHGRIINKPKRLVVE